MRQDSDSPLHFAAEKDHEGVLRLLLQNNADAKSMNNVSICPIRTHPSTLIEMLLLTSAQDGITALKLASFSTKSILVDAIVREEALSIQMTLCCHLVDIDCHLPPEIARLIVSKWRPWRILSFADKEF